MKKLFFILLLLPSLVFSQETKTPNLYESVNITVKKGQEKEFEAAVKAHNAAYHAEGDYHARLFYNINGPDGGTYSWIMRPTSYTAMDSRPMGGLHDEDWEKVNQYVEKIGSPSYWSMNEKLTQVVDSDKNDKRLIWVYDIKKGQFDRWKELVAKVKKVYEEKRPDETFAIAMNDFADTKAGMDAAVIFAFDKWAWMDRDDTFPMEYESVHGPGTFQVFLTQFRETVNGRVDWLRYQVK